MSSASLLIGGAAQTSTTLAINGTTKFASSNTVRGEQNTTSAVHTPKMEKQFQISQKAWKDATTLMRKLVNGSISVYTPKGESFNGSANGLD